MAEASVIVGIHGLANKPPMPEKGEWWKNAIIEGLQLNCGKTTETLPFDFVYWRVLRYENPVSNDENSEPYWRDLGTGPFPAYRTHKWIEIIGAATKIVGTELDFLDLHTGSSGVGDFVLDRELKDLAAYYEDPVFREAVRSRLKEKILQYRDRRIMVIGHSMGSIIAYDVLRRLGRDEPQLRVDHFVTIGSPLGMAHVKFRISQENDLVRTPRGANAKCRGAVDKFCRPARCRSN